MNGSDNQNVYAFRGNVAGAVFADGSVRSLSGQTSIDTLIAPPTRARGEMVDLSVFE